MPQWFTIFQNDLLAIEDGGESPEDEEPPKSLLEVCMLMMVPVSISDDVVPVSISDGVVPVSISDDVLPVSISDDMLPKYVLNDFGSSICDDSSISIKLYCTKYANI